MYISRKIFVYAEDCTVCKVNQFDLQGGIPSKFTCKSPSNGFRSVDTNDSCACPPPRPVLVDEMRTWEMSGKILKDLVVSAMSYVPILGDEAEKHNQLLVLSIQRGPMVSTQTCWNHPMPQTVDPDHECCTVSSSSTCSFVRCRDWYCAISM